MSDFYQAPNAELVDDDSTGMNDLEKAKHGDYDLDIGDIISSSWSIMKGHKTNILVASLLYIMVSSIASIVAPISATALSVIDPNLAAAVSATLSMLSGLIVMPFALGVMYLGIQVARDAPYKTMDVFIFVGKILPIILGTLLMYVLVIAGFILLIIPGIYLSVAYGYALMLMADKNLPMWEAFETSRKAVTKKWFSVFAIYILVCIIMFLSILPLFIGLLWTIPFSIIVYGRVYQAIFESSSVTAQTS